MSCQSQTTSPFKIAVWEMYLAGHSNVYLLSIFGAINMKWLRISNLEEMREHAVSTRELLISIFTWGHDGACREVVWGQNPG